MELYKDEKLETSWLIEELYELCFMFNFIFFIVQTTLKDLFTIEPSTEATNTQPSITKTEPIDEVVTQESQEESETSAEVGSTKTGAGKVSQNLLEQVHRIHVLCLHVWSQFRLHCFVTPSCRHCLKQKMNRMLVLLQERRLKRLQN